MLFSGNSTPTHPRNANNVETYTFAMLFPGNLTLAHFLAAETATTGASETEHEREELEDRLTELTTLHDDMRQRYDAQVTDNAQLSR